MPAPSTVPTWATDATFTSGPKLGSPTKVTPSAGAIAQGDVPDDAYRAERHNWRRNLVGQWLTWLSTINTQSDFLNRVFDWTGYHSYVNLPTIATGALSAIQEDFLPLATAQAATWGYSVSNGTLVNPTGSGQQAHIPILCPTLCTLTNFRVGLRAGGSNPITVSLLRFRPNISTGSVTRTVLGTVTVSPVTYAVATLSTPISHTVDRTAASVYGGGSWYALEVVSGGTTDIVYWATISYTQVRVGEKVA